MRYQSFIISQAMLPKPLLLALAFRSISLLFPQTYFQPDEYWQSLEVAHEYVFGYGFLTWEWRDLPDGGRLRGWIWPGVFVIIYRFLQITGLDDTRLLVCPTFLGMRGADD
jgi:phosphatidylinositol glycan class B